MLARLMKGAQISLFIGIVAPLLFILLGVVYGSFAGFVGGKTDALLMRFADFVVALPFLLFMILFKLVFGIGAGESGILPMLVALVLLSWPAAARLVRGQILQIREEGYIDASRLLGTKTTTLDPAPHDSEHHGGDPGHVHICGAIHHLHRSISVVHRNWASSRQFRRGQACATTVARRWKRRRTN